MNMMPDWTAWNGNLLSPIPTNTLNLPTIGSAGAAAAPLVGTKTPIISQTSGGAMGALGKMELALAGLQTLGNLWNSFQANKLAKKQFKFQKNFAETNLANQIKSYNTALSDRINARSHVEGRPEGYANSYYEQNKLTRKH